MLLGWQPALGSLTRQHWAYTQWLASTDLADLADLADAGPEAAPPPDDRFGVTGGITMPDGRTIPAGRVVGACGAAALVSLAFGMAAGRYGLLPTLAGAGAAWLLLGALGDGDGR